jgi:hypothetical protein
MYFIGFSPLILACRELDYKPDVVGLDVSRVRGAISVAFAALFADVVYDISSFGIGCRADRTELAAAIVCAVTGVYIHVK